MPLFSRKWFRNIKMLFILEIFCRLVKKQKTLLYHKSMTHRNANTTIKCSRWWAEQTREIQDNKLWTPWNPKVTLQCLSYVTTGWLQWAKCDLGQTIGSQCPLGISHSISISQDEENNTALLISLDCPVSPFSSCCKSFSLQLSASHVNTWSRLLWGTTLQLLEIFLPTFKTFIQTFSQIKQNKALKLVQGLLSPAPLGTTHSINHKKNSESHQSTTNLLPNDLLQAAGCKLHPLVSHPFLHFILELKTKTCF